MKRVCTALLCLLILSIAPTTSAAAKKSSSAPPDKAFMQQIITAWATLDPANAAKYYASGPNTFFDIAPLKYNSWDEYQAGVKKILADYKSAKFTVNDDATIHSNGDPVWATATVSSEMTTKAGKVEMGTFRWTIIWQNENGKWVIVHDHFSAPLQ
jgi:ketosteroid isomerase-like protein